MQGNTGRVGRGGGGTSASGRATATDAGPCRPPPPLMSPKTGNFLMALDWKTLPWHGRPLASFQRGGGTIFEKKGLSEINRKPRGILPIHAGWKTSGNIKKKMPSSSTFMEILALPLYAFNTCLGRPLCPGHSICIGCFQCPAFAFRQNPAGVRSQDSRPNLGAVEPCLGLLRHLRETDFRRGRIWEGF